MGLVAGGQLHGDAEGHELELALFQRDVLRGTQVDPVGFPVDVPQLLDLVRKVFDANGLTHL